MYFGADEGQGNIVFTFKVIEKLKNPWTKF